VASRAIGSFEIDDRLTTTRNCKPRFFLYAKEYSLLPLPRGAYFTGSALPACLHEAWDQPLPLRVKTLRIGQALYDAFSASEELAVKHLLRCKKLKENTARIVSSFLEFRPTQILFAAVPRQELEALLTELGPFDPHRESEESWVTRVLESWLGIFVPEERDDDTSEEADFRFEQIQKQPFSDGGFSPYSRSDLDVGYVSSPNAVQKMKEYLLACRRAVASKRPTILWGPNGGTLHASWPCRSLQVISVTLSTEAASILFPDFCATSLMFNGRRRLICCERSAPSPVPVDATRARMRSFARVVSCELGR
jgi:hypothetical protein